MTERGAYCFPPLVLPGGFTPLGTAAWWLAVISVISILAACGGGPVPSSRPEPEPYPSGSPAHEAPPLAPTPAYVGPRDPAVTDADLDALWALRMLLPVRGIARDALQDTFSAGRSNGRTHSALDILAPRGTPVLAATDCIIGRLSSGPVGGIIIYAYDPLQQFVFYYAHLDRYRRGLSVGDRISRGAVIGYVGTSGNAPKDLPHLHFQVMKYVDGRAWWNGPPINPFPYFGPGEPSL